MKGRAGASGEDNVFLPIRGWDKADALNALVVEDDPDVSSLIQMAIQAWELPLNVDFINNGYDAIRSMMREKPDLIILDLRLPVLDGFTVMHSIRDAGYYFPIVVITGLCKEDVSAIGDLPENSYLIHKPIDLVRFKKILVELVNKKNQLQEYIK